MHSDIKKIDTHNSWNVWNTIYKYKKILKRILEVQKDPQKNSLRHPVLVEKNSSLLQIWVFYVLNDDKKIARSSGNMIFFQSYLSL